MVTEQRNAKARGSVAAMDAELRRAWEALAACPPLRESSPPRDELWVVMRDVLCTRSLTWVTPVGSTRPVRVTPDYATDELIAVMAWLQSHEDEARQLGPVGLFKRLRSVGTRGATGSARAAQNDALRGLTGVAAGRPVLWANVDECGAA